MRQNRYVILNKDFEKAYKVRDTTDTWWCAQRRMSLSRWVMVSLGLLAFVCVCVCVFDLRAVIRTTSSDRIRNSSSTTKATVAPIELERRPSPLHHEECTAMRCCHPAEVSVPLRLARCAVHICIHHPFKYS